MESSTDKLHRMYREPVAKKIESPHDLPKTTDERLDALSAIIKHMAGDVLHVRMALDPIGVRVRVAIIAGSAFLGGAMTNAIFWLAGVEPLLWHHR